MKALAWWSLGCAAIPTLLCLKNLSLYRPAPALTAGAWPRISVLIPARDEEQNIRDAVNCALASTGVELEVIVLDDHSSDRTVEIITEIAAKDPRVRLEHAPDLPPGWCGKQYGCWTLAQLASFPLVAFVDADVRISPDALSRAVAFLESSGTDLISGVPRQITVTWLEDLLIPLIHFVLLGFLPLDRMRADTSPAYGAGCGQLFVARLESYFAAGGHQAIKASMHDGIMLPRAFRRAGFRTDLFDATDIATCRMYHSARQVWSGLGKNAAEGMAHPRVIGPMSVLLVSGQILPWILVLFSPSSWVGWIAGGLSLVPRLQTVLRFRQPFWSAMAHPFGVLLLLVIQWRALALKLSGRPTAWRGRTVQPVAQ